MYFCFFNALIFKVSIALFFAFKDKESLVFCKHLPTDEVAALT